MEPRHKLHAPSPSPLVNWQFGSNAAGHMNKVTITEEQAEALIAADLKKIGITAKSPWHFVDEYYRLPWNREIAEILARHINKPYPDRVIHGILTVAGRPETRDLLLKPAADLMRQRDGGYLGQFAANAIVRMVNAKDVSLLKELLLDENIGVSRALLMGIFVKLAKKDSERVLMLLANQPKVGVFALQALSKLGSQSIRPMLEKLLKSVDLPTREIAKNSLKVLNKKTMN